ncbi:MAG: YidC/Oxa1 family membrane protein insertase [Lachnospiraceae bacterium]|nr:YidC/Oxa1 family membrane protein insertase [Lachnospiraceae bacterium]MBR5917618.1 YidC/Oxa1 family membrane protein insertase [Lachnospiraceae bacterium]
MYDILLTQNKTIIIGQVAWVLGKLMDGIFFVLDKIASLYGGTANIGVAIIIFTVIIYLLMLPLTIKQQKFSKMSAIMNPEIQAIQAKYKGTKDPDQMQMMQQETNAVYAKYGVSPSGSCVQLLIQMPILFALYRVIYAIPAYVPMVKNVFIDTVNSMMGLNSTGTALEKPEVFMNSAKFIQDTHLDEKAKTINNISSFIAYKKQFKPDFLNIDTISLDNITSNLINSPDAAANIETTRNTFIDVLNRASSTDWNYLSQQLPDFAQKIAATRENLEKFNTFLGINIGYSPKDTILSAWAGRTSADSKAWILIILVAVMIPLLAALTQWIGIKLAPTAQNNNNNGQEENPMMSSMKMMNTFMPIMSAVFCFTLPAGMGIYWIVGAVVRSVQQVAINKYIDKMDIDKEIEKNTAKYEEKLKKKGIIAQGINSKANNNTKYVNPYARGSKNTSTNNTPAKPVNNVKNNDKISSSGSIASKARMVKEYNEKNNK